MEYLSPNHDVLEVTNSDFSLVLCSHSNKLLFHYHSALYSVSSSHVYLLPGCCTDLWGWAIVCSLPSVRFCFFFSAASLHSHSVSVTTRNRETWCIGRLWKTRKHLVNIIWSGVSTLGPPRKPKGSMCTGIFTFVHNYNTKSTCTWFVIAMDQAW